MWAAGVVPVQRTYRTCQDVQPGASIIQSKALRIFRNIWKEVCEAHPVLPCGGMFRNQQLGAMYRPTAKQSSEEGSVTFVYLRDTACTRRVYGACAAQARSLSVSP